MTPSHEEIASWLPTPPRGTFWHVVTTPFGPQLRLKQKVRIFFGLIPYERTVEGRYLYPEVWGWEKAFKSAASHILNKRRFAAQFDLRVEKNK